MNNIPRRYNTFTNIYGKTFDKVNEIAYNEGELFGNIGIFVNETKPEKNIFFNDEYNLSNGVYIYQDFNNQNIAYRIYQAFADYGFNGHNDDILIQKLAERKENIKLTEFPTGVVTLDGKIIGQQIPYYPNSISLFEYFKNNQNINLNDIYISILNILKELYDNGIAYYDIHSKNFVIYNDQINLIDFDYCFMSFDNDKEKELKKLLYNYINLVNNLYRLYTKTTSDIFEKTETFDETYDQVKKRVKRF